MHVLWADSNNVQVHGLMAVKAPECDIKRLNFEFASDLEFWLKTERPTKYRIVNYYRRFLPETYRLIDSDTPGPFPFVFNVTFHY
jgi:hypothetical protein